MTIVLRLRTKVRTQHTVILITLLTSESSFSGLCLDLTNGDTTNENQVQTWQCTDNDFNQVWAPVIPQTDVIQIHPNGNLAKCVDIRDADFSIGTPVQM